MSRFVLAAEPDRVLLNFVRSSLQNGELKVITAQGAIDAMARAAAWSPAIAVVGTGFGEATVDLVRELRREYGLQSLVLAKPREDNRVARALEAGAIGFVALPATRAELARRVREALEARTVTEGSLISSGPVTLDLERRAVVRPLPAGRLTPCEFEMLRWMLSCPGRTFTRRQLLASDRAAFAPRAKPAQVDRFVGSLQRKLGAAGGLIEMAGAVGWRYAAARARGAGRRSRDEGAVG